MTRTNEQNLDLFADLIEPVAEILSDKEVVSAIRQGKKPIKAIKPAIKNHHDSIIQILALVEGVEPEQYIVPPPAALAMKILNMLNDPTVNELFTTQVPKTDAESSGPAMEATEDGVL